MKYRSLAVLCALALTLACPAPVYGAEEEPLTLPPELTQTEQTQTEQPQTEQTTQPEQTPAPLEEGIPVAPPVQGTEPENQPVQGIEPEGQPVQGAETEMVLVGLVYGSNALAGANLANDVGSGYRFGYMDEQRNFWQVGYTSESSLSVVKTQNVYYGYPYGPDGSLTTYSDTVTSDILVGCWHVQLPGEYATFEEAQIQAWNVGGFPAWINGVYQVRFGAYGSQEDAQAAAEQMGGSVVGTSAYGVSVVKTKTNTVLFQFDGGEANSLAVKPGTDDTVKTVTHFKGGRYYGSFQFQRVGGGNLTVINALNLDDYTNCVITQEMSPSWPMEALKAQAVCARTYWEYHKNKHGSDGFDLCATTDCQAYPGMGAVTERTTQAIQETANQRIWYEGEPIDAVYFASDGGGTEDVRNVWGGDIPYLRGLIDPYEETISEKIAFWDNVMIYTASELNAAIQPYMQKKGYNCAAIVDFQITELSPTGNVLSIAFTDANGTVWPFTKSNAATIARTYLGIKSIRYTITKSGETTGGTYYVDDGGTLSAMNNAYAINGNGKTRKLTGNPYVITASGIGFLPAPTGGAPAEEGETVFTITSRGYGHNVGMSQWGAYAMAQQGFTFRDILTFYYSDVEIY